MNQETASLLSLGEYDEELQKKIITDVERIIFSYISRNIYEIGNLLLSQHHHNLERVALRALKNHLNNASNIY